MKLSKKGTTPSQIGVLLRDLHGVGQVTTVTGTKILRILRKQGLAPEIPEDLYFLIKKAVSMRKHLDRFRKDRDTKFRLILVESRIHRLARYYKVCLTLHCCIAALVPAAQGPWPMPFRRELWIGFVFASLLARGSPREYEQQQASVLRSWDLFFARSVFVE